MKTFAPALTAALIAVATLGFASTSAVAATKKPPARTQAARAAADHNRKVEADKAQRNARMAKEKSQKDAKKAAKAAKAGK